MNIFTLAFVLLLSSAFAQDFEQEAPKLAQDLKTSLMKNLSEKVAKEGAVKAIPFCHENVKPIAKTAAGDRISKYEFGRTSHKLRNEGNKSAPWAEVYLKDFQGTFQKDGKKPFFHKLENGKKVYLEPLYVQPQCLACHGENVASDVKAQLNQLYPKDQATGFKLGEFRGFIWVKEK